MLFLLINKFSFTTVGTIATTLADISFPPIGDTVYCCGLNGNIWSINITGVTKMNSGVVETQSSISFPINSSEGWVCGGSILFHFVNNAWIGDQFRPSGGYNAIQMVDTLIGWAVGSGGTIIHTTNGGAEWRLVAIGLTTNTLTGVHFTSPTNGYVVGNGNTLLKYTELSGIGDEVEALPFAIFPTPARSEVNIQSPIFSLQSSLVEIYDLTGRKLIEKHNPAGNESIEMDVSSLESGIYFYRLIVEDKSVTKKLIIK